MLVWALIAAGIALTESRGGILAAGVTTLGSARRRDSPSALADAPAARPPQRRPPSSSASLFVATAVGAPRFYRFLESDPRDLSGNTRVALWKTSLAAWREFPIVGSGLGTFREAFRRVQPRELKGLVEQAHNDFLQLAVTGGAVGAALGVLLFASLFVLLFRAWARQRHREESAFALAGFGALLSPDAPRPGRVQSLDSGDPGNARLRARNVVGCGPTGLERTRLYFRPASKGTATVIQEATAFPPFCPGSKSHWRTAATAA